jgi:hypothetical protein
MEPKVLEIQRTHLKIKLEIPNKNKNLLKKGGIKLDKTLNPIKGSF